MLWFKSIKSRQQKAWDIGENYGGVEIDKIHIQTAADTQGTEVYPDFRVYYSGFVGVGGFIIILGYGRWLAGTFLFFSPWASGSLVLSAADSLADSDDSSL